jgi:hypothetical protein
VKATTRRRLENLAIQSGLCAGCAARASQESYIASFAERVHQNARWHLDNQTPDDLREQAQHLLAQADKLEALNDLSSPPGGRPVVTAETSLISHASTGSEEASAV